MENKKIRVSLTKKQQESELGCNLLELCKNLTDDGILTDEEIITLKEFIDIQEDSIPAIQFLKSKINDFYNQDLESFKNKKYLYKSIESIMPVVDRKAAKEKRTSLEKAERSRNAVLLHENFMVAGCKRGSRSENVDGISIGDRATLEREYDNEHDEYAVLVFHNGFEIGYVPKDQAKQVALMLDRKTKYKAYFKKLLSDYSDKAIPVVSVLFYNEDSDELPTEKDKFSKHGDTQKSGCGLFSILFFSCTLLSIYLIIK